MYHDNIMCLGRSLGIDTEGALSGDDIDKLDVKKCKDVVNKVLLT